MQQCAKAKLIWKKVGRGDWKVKKKKNGGAEMGDGEISALESASVSLSACQFFGKTVPTIIMGMCISITAKGLCPTHGIGKA